MRLPLILIVLLSSITLQAQVKFDAKATGKHADAINQAKGTKQSAEERREQAKRIRQQTKARKEYKARYEAIKAERTDSLGNFKKYSKEDYELSKYERDSLQIDLFTKEDSLAISNEILESTDFPPEYRELIINPIQIQPNQLMDNDSLALAEAVAILEGQAKKFMPNELGEVDDPLTALTEPVDGMSTLGAPSKPNPNLVRPQKAKELFKQVDPEDFKDAQLEMQKLKRKYDKVPDTRYPKEGTKRNSLEDKPFKNRIYFGGNISAQSTDPLIGAMNLQLGYWINKNWLGGIGITLREQFTKEDSIPRINGDGYGYSVFTRYNIPKGFFAWLEVERQAKGSLFGSETQVATEWQSAYLGGIGREFKLGFVQMLSMVLYDFNYKNNDMNARPLVFKLGVRFTKQP
ncbi:MAG: hypothetical protein HRT61_13500 [Ekhidna sp.]|nr:hypothetical protein [Ekhidna sp.]